MTEHAATYETLGARHPGAAGNRVDTSFNQLIPSMAFGGDDADLIPYPFVPPSGYSTVPIAEGTIFVSGATSEYYKGFGNLTQVIKSGASVDNSESFFQRGTGLISAVNTGRIGARVRAIFNGATKPGSVDGQFGQIHWAHLNDNYNGFQHFVEFEDFPPGSQSDADAAVRALLNKFNQSTNQFQIGVDGTGKAILLENCGFAGLAPEGAVFVRPEDIGAGDDQIPVATVDNTAAKFRKHPSVFYPSGKALYIRSVSRQAIDNLALDDETASSNGGPIGITTVDSAPTTSNWVVSVDGQKSILQLAHPEGSDFRRPRDIWNNVWVPILQGPSDVGSMKIFEGGNNIGGTAAFRWAYADYFRCLPLAGTNIFQVVPA